MTHTILLALVPIFFVLWLGFHAGRWHRIDNQHVDSLNALTMQIALPMALFVATASATRNQLLSQATLFLVFGGIMLIVFLAWYLIATRLTGMPSADASLQALTIAFPNLAGVGLPVLADLIGPSGTVPLAVALAAGSIIISPLSLILVELSIGKEQGAGGNLADKILHALWRSVTKPIVLAPAAGILIALLGIPLNDIVEASLNLMGRAAAGIALFLTGLVLSSQPFRLDRTTIAATLAANVGRAALALAAVSILHLSEDVARIIVLLAAVPSGFFGILFGVSYRRDPAALGSMVMASTVLSIVTMAIAIAFLFPS